MRAIALILCSVLLKAAQSDTEWCDSDWRREDSDLHGCRSCESVFVEEEGNCPTSGFKCDVQKPLHTPVLTADSCNCVSTKCADRGWRLAVNGTIIDKITCKDKQWVTAQGDAVSSAVCAAPSACKVCKKELITYSPNSAEAEWQVGVLDGVCAQLSATCTGTGAVEAKVNGQSIAPDTMITAECGPDGTQWLYKGQEIKTLDCIAKKGCPRYFWAPYDVTKCTTDVNNALNSGTYTGCTTVPFSTEFEVNCKTLGTTLVLTGPISQADPAPLVFIPAKAVCLADQTWEFQNAQGFSFGTLAQNEAKVGSPVQLACGVY